LWGPLSLENSTTVLSSIFRSLSFSMSRPISASIRVIIAA